MAAKDINMNSLKYSLSRKRSTTSFNTGNPTGIKATRYQTNRTIPVWNQTTFPKDKPIPQTSSPKEINSALYFFIILPF